MLMIVICTFDFVDFSHQRMWSHHESMVLKVVRLIRSSD